MIVRRMLGVLGSGPSPDADTVEIAVLRHLLAVLHRQVPRPRYTPTDRMLPAWGLARLLPRDRWAAFLLTPSTLLRWHRPAGHPPPDLPSHWSWPTRPRPGQFLTAQARGLAACDFFTVETVALTRRSTTTAGPSGRHHRHPTGPWVRQQARNALMDLDDRLQRLRFGTKVPRGHPRRTRYTGLPLVLRPAVAAPKLATCQRLDRRSW
jgi:hypothetical protein